MVCLYQLIYGSVFSNDPYIKSNEGHSVFGFDSNLVFVISNECMWKGVLVHFAFL